MFDPNWKLLESFRNNGDIYKAFIIYIFITLSINELLCLKNAGTQISMFFTSNEYIIGNPGNWKNQNPGDRFGANS